MTTPPLFHHGSIVTDSDTHDFSEEYSLPPDIVSELVAKIRLTGTAYATDYPEQYWDGIAEFMVNIQTHPPEAKADDVVDRAAFGLMGAMAGDGTFLITEEGICTINPSNPPELSHAYQVVANVLKLRDLGDVIDDRSTWMLGSICSELRAFFGESFDPSQVCELTEVSYNTVYTAEKVYEHFKGKRKKLSFSHHKEAFFQKVSDEAKDLVLSKAETYGLGAKQVRELCCIIKTMDDDQVVRNIRSKSQAEDLIAAHKENKVTYLVLNENEWWKINGNASSIPTGRLVIDTKNLTVRKDNGDPVEIQTKTKKSGK
jgi:hypothetical protein